MDEKIKQEIISKYVNGSTNKDLSIEYQIHRDTILKILKRANVSLRQKFRKKQLDERLFEQIDTQEKSYFLGLVYSDGNLFKYDIEICLVKSDEQLLEDISNYIYGQSYLKYRSVRDITIGDKTFISNEQVRFSISSKKITEDLMKIGLHPNKSLTIVFPEILKDNEDLTRHFIRGFFDGDGCLHIDKKIGNDVVSITTNHQMCVDLKTEISKYLNINVCVRSNQTKQNVESISITGRKQIKAFLDWIYKDATLKLGRKHQLYLDHYLNYKEQHGIPVKRISENGETKIYENAQVAYRDVGLHDASTINKVCHHLQKTAAGYFWEFIK